MQLLKVAAGVVNQTPLDWAGNKANILNALADARAQQVKILCLPELCICGYGCEDAFHSPGLSRTAWEVLQEILPATQGMIVALGLPVFHQNALFNAACLAADGKILGFAAKRFLAGGGIHYEPRWFKPWPSSVRTELVVNGTSYPLGDLYFECGGIKIGFEICEDAWVAQRPGGSLSLEGVDILLNPSASHFAFGKMEIRKRFVLEGSRAFGVTYVYTNLLGNEAGRAIYDGGAIIASGGSLVALGPRFSCAGHSVTSAVVDIDATRMSQARTGSFMPVLSGTGANVVRAEFGFPAIAPEPPSLQEDTWESGERAKEEEFTRAVTLALFDYMRKSRSCGFVVSLSGGADSSAVSCLVALMVERAVKELGGDEVLRKLPYWKGLAAPEIRACLTCVYQGTENSSATGQRAARELAHALGAAFLELEIGGIAQEYVDLVSRSLGRTITWEADDIALQNIQARVRAPGVWLIANLRNALLLTTSDRSEAAVGYATMDGDTCGGVAPIAGVDKHFLRQWLCWLQEKGPEGLHAIPALAAVNAQVPTPELRPLDMQQTAEADLMPYDLLDAVERAVIRDKKTPAEAFQLLRVQFPTYEAGQLAAWIERFFRLWCRNQWKRERYAPSFHLDDENLDPKTWCRFPILSGGFERELAELRAHVARP
ncbi:MAG: NAD+ synthetase [Planctomycetota bacterium]|nr:NAD+ synthetase [Planctomycetota bacterium]